jgi:hypothetical protein
MTCCARDHGSWRRPAIGEGRSWGDLRGWLGVCLAGEFVAAVDVSNNNVEGEVGQAVGRDIIAMVVDRGSTSLLSALQG